MKTALMTLTALVAFAANSLLNRWAMVDGTMGPAAFASIRLVSGAVVLTALSLAGQGAWRPKFTPVPGLALAVYAIGFSFAYVTLDTGIGALILFGGVQLTMFALAFVRGEGIGRFRVVGAVVSLGGLVVLLWPSQGGQLSIMGAGLMGIAAIGWGVYTYIGRSAVNPLQATAGNFIWAAPLGLALFLAFPDGVSMAGFWLAVMSGAVTSGIGYAIWYAVLPRIETSLAAVLQLCVPILAAGLGVLILGEGFTVKLAIATALVLAGTLLALRHPT